MASVNPKFEESQRFTQWWVWVILIGAFFLPFIVNYEAIVKGEVQINADPGGLLIPLMISVLVILLFLVLNLKTKIDRQGIHIGYFPIVKKDFEWSNIQSIKVIKYTLFQVGGWGFRFGTRFGTVYNVRGTRGIYIKTKTGQEYLIGTQKPEEVKEIIKQYYKN